MKEFAQTAIKGASVQFDNDVPNAVRSEVIRFWPTVAPYVPRWCREILFVWKPNPVEGEACSISANFSYKWATIYLTGNWLGEDDSLKIQNLLHELSHLYVEPIAEYAREMFDTLIKDDAPRFHETAIRELTHRVEQSVQELSWNLHDNLKGGF